jgi:hypothetical protein
MCKARNKHAISFQKLGDCPQLPDQLAPRKHIINLDDADSEPVRISDPEIETITAMVKFSRMCVGPIFDHIRNGEEDSKTIVSFHKSDRNVVIKKHPTEILIRGNPVFLQWKEPVSKSANGAAKNFGKSLSLTYMDADTDGKRNFKYMTNVRKPSVPGAKQSGIHCTGCRTEDEVHATCLELIGECAKILGLPPPDPLHSVHMTMILVTAKFMIRREFEEAFRGKTRMAEYFSQCGVQSEFCIENYCSGLKGVYSGETFIIYDSGHMALWTKKVPDMPLEETIAEKFAAITAVMRGYLLCLPPSHT